MKTLNQNQIAKAAGISQSMLSQILGGQRRAGWRTAKSLSSVLGIPEKVFLEGSLDEIKLAIEREAAQ